MSRLTDETTKFAGLTFLCAPVGRATPNFLGNIIRVLREVKKRNKDKSNMVKLRPHYTFSSSGGELTSYMMEAFDWEIDDLNGEKGIVSFLNDKQYTLDIAQNWYGLPIIGLIIGFFKGSFFQMGTAIPGLVDLLNHRVNQAPTKGYERITSTTRVIDSKLIAFTNMTPNDPRSVFYNSPANEEYTKRRLKTVVSYNKLPEDFNTQQEYEDFNRNRAIFRLASSSGIPGFFSDNYPPENIRGNNATMSGNNTVNVDTRSSLAESAANLSGTNDLQNNAITNNRYQDGGVTTTTPYELFVDIIQANKHIKNYFLWLNDDIPLGNENSNLFTNFLYGISQIIGTFNEEKFVYQQITEYGRYNIAYITEYAIKDNKVTKATTSPGGIISDDPFTDIANLLNIDDLNNGSDFAVIIRNNILDQYNPTNTDYKEFFTQIDRGYNNMRITIIKQGKLIQQRTE
jgi:hypothetical protein